MILDLYRFPLALGFPAAFPFVFAGGLAGAFPFGGAFFFGRASEPSDSLPFTFFASCAFLSAARNVTNAEPSTRKNPLTLRSFPLQLVPIITFTTTKVGAASFVITGVGSVVEATL